MTFHNHHGTTHSPDKMLPVDMANRSCRWELEMEDTAARNGRYVRVPGQRLTSVIRELKKRHRKKSRAYGKRICRELAL